MRAAAALALAGLLASGAAPLLANDAGEANGTRASLARLMAADTRLQTIGWRLARANAPFCPDTAPAIGLLLLDAANFRDPAAIRTALSLPGNIAVDAVAQGSPAARAGLRGGEAITAIDGSAMSALPPAPAGDYARLETLHARIAEGLAASGMVTLTIDGRAIVLAGEPTCRSRFEVGAGGQKAVADGDRVIVSEAMLAALPDDGVAAAVVAHELAHNILRHRARLAAGGRSPAAVRAAEQEADRLAPWLMANAGYDPGGALRLAELRGRRLADRLLPAASHGSWRTRAATIRAEIARIAAAQTVSPAAPLDWRPRFAITP